MATSDNKPKWESYSIPPNPKSGMPTQTVFFRSWPNMPTNEYEFSMYIRHFDDEPHKYHVTLSPPNHSPKSCDCILGTYPTLKAAKIAYLIIASANPGARE